MDKSHVQHPVRFIQHKDLHMGQIDLTLAEQVVEASGGCYQDIDAAPQGFDLGIGGYAAEDDGAFDGGVGTVLIEVFRDLQCQFPGRSEDQGADHTLWIFLFVGIHQVLYDGQGKCRSLSGACLGAAQHVPSSQHIRDRLFLDRRWGYIAFFFQCFQKQGRKFQIFKIHRYISFISVIK